MSFIPPRSVAKEARAGLNMHKHFKRGMTNVGVRRAVQLSRRDPVSLSTIKRMYSFFRRHYKNRNSITKSGDPGNGMIAWLGWGGDSGYNWVVDILDSEE